MQAMSSCHFVLHLWLFSSVTRTCATSSSKWFRDRSFDNKIYSLGSRLITRSLLHCADVCRSNNTCKSFFFAESQPENCMILSTVLPQQSENILDLERSAYYILGKYPGILFRGTVGLGSQFQMDAAWLAAGPGTTTDTSCRNVKLNGCSKHYRHPIIDDWATLNPQQLRYSVYKNEVEVAWVLFNATGSNKTNWFNQTRILSSSYTDLTPSATCNIFELNYSYPNIARHFYVSADWSGCNNDHMWLCTYEDHDNCGIGNYGNYSYILYSKLGVKAHQANIANFGFGDCAIVTVIS